MRSLRSCLLLLMALALTLTPGCALAKVSTAVTGLSKAGTATKLASAGKVATAGKVGSSGKIAIGAGAVAAVDETWRVGRLFGSADDVRFLPRNTSALETAGSPALDAAVGLTDFADWVQSTEPETGHPWGEGAPPEVGLALQSTVQDGETVTPCKQFGACWMQGVRDQSGDAIAAYDPKTQRAVLLSPKAKP
jgi:hypothetical protein